LEELAQEGAGVVAAGEGFADECGQSGIGAVGDHVTRRNKDEKTGE